MRRSLNLGAPRTEVLTSDANYAFTTVLSEEDAGAHRGSPLLRGRLNAMEQLLERARMAEGDDKNQGGDEHEHQAVAF
jgi:hypothetical protein